MVSNLLPDVNELTFVVAPNMIVEILPDERLLPVVFQSPSQQPALVYLAGLGKSSRRTMWYALCVVSAVLSAGECTPVTLPWAQLRYQHVNAMRSWAIENRGAATGQRYIAAMRATMREAWRLGLMSAEDYHRSIDVKPIKRAGPSQAAGRALSNGEIVALANTCRLDPSPAGVRDAVLLGLGVRCGLRRAEMSKLEIGDYDPEDAKLIVHGKGGKVRTVYVGPGVNDALADWLHLRGQDDGPLLLAINKGGRILPNRLSDGCIYVALAKRAKAAGVRKFSPHDLRRTFAGDLLDAGADIATVQKIMGHVSADTTAGYDRRGERAKKEAAGRLHLPYTRRYE